jgi:two-component system LytT family response regulator
MKKVIIVDDERAGRELISEYLLDYPELIGIAEANNGVDAVKQINEFQPDLVFLDIQMPGLTGFQVIPHLVEIPQIIFSTAYDAYALEAFEVHAVDYLLKPYTKERFKKAITRTSLEQEINNIGSLAESLMINQQQYPEHILVNKNKKLLTLETSAIIWIEAYGDYAKLHTADQVFVSNYGITALEERLNPKVFMRVHRSFIINLKQILSVEKYGKGYDIHMKNNEHVKVSRGFAHKLKELMF